MAVNSIFVSAFETDQRVLAPFTPEPKAAFAWTPATVLRALDAGIAEVSAIYNTQYFNGVLLYGPSGGAAHAHAARATAIQLQTADNYAFLVREAKALDALVEAMSN